MFDGARDMYYNHRMRTGVMRTRMKHIGGKKHFRILAAVLAALLLSCSGCGRSDSTVPDDGQAGMPGSGPAPEAGNAGMPAAGADDAGASAGGLTNAGQTDPADAAETAGTGTETAAEDAGLGAQTAEPAPADTDPEAEDESLARKEQLRIEQQISAKLQTMTLQQKVAQMFIVTPDALTGVTGTTVCGDITRDALSRLPVGGLIFMQENLQNADQTSWMLQMTQQLSLDLTGLPAFFFVDEEGGSVTRISGSEGFPEVPLISSMAVIGTTGDPAQARAMGETIGGYLAALGFNADFAPDADVLSNPDNQVIGTRSFGTDPQMVGDMAVSLAQGLEAQGVIACYKHFPGHGATAADTHEGYAYTNKTLEELQACELVPFQKAIDAGARMIMVAHMSLPNVIGLATPASLSPYMLKNILREQMGFTGIIITDAMNMGAIADIYAPADAAVLAVQAGADMILMPGDLWAAYTAVVHAVENGQIPEGQIDETVRRILRVKAHL